MGETCVMCRAIVRICRGPGPQKARSSAIQRTPEVDSHVEEASSRAVEELQGIRVAVASCLIASSPQRAG